MGKKPILVHVEKKKIISQNKEQSIWLNLLTYIDFRLESRDQIDLF